jgi:hypothetical protein
VKAEYETQLKMELANKSRIICLPGKEETVRCYSPIVTINHDYTRSPVGRSLWRKKVKDGTRHGVKAKTLFPTRPDEWTDPVWPSDTAWSLVKSGLMGGKSIGFLTLKAHAPTDEEVKRRPELQRVRRIVDEWALLEYCCCWLPVNPEAVVEAVSKSLITPEALKAVGVEVPTQPRIIPFTPLDEIQRALDRQLAAANPQALAARLLREAVQRGRGAA